MFVVTLLAFAFLWTMVFQTPPLDDGLVVAEQQQQKQQEEKIIQKLAPIRPGFSVDDEIQMACDEVDCVKTCTHLSSSGEKVVDPACRRNCAKTRCKKRCKAEPTTSYVERETKRERCIDRCDRNKPNDEKCLKICDDESKKCTDRCKERAKRFFCVRDLDRLPQEEDFDPAQFEDDAGPI